MAATSKSLVLVLTVLAAAAVAQSVRVSRQVHHPHGYPWAPAAPAPVHPAEDDGSYWPGKYPDDPVPPPAPAAPAPAPYYAPAPAPYAPAPAPYYAPAPAPYAPYRPAPAPYKPAPYYHAPTPAPSHEDDGSWYPGKYGPE